MLRLITRQAHRLLLKPEWQLNHVKVMATIAMLESNGGRNNMPRQEASFFDGGKYANPETLGRWARSNTHLANESIRALSSCSWGPWQVMYPVAVELGYKAPPWALWRPESSLLMAIIYLNKRTIPEIPLDTTAERALEMLLDGYNSGSARDDYVPAEYIKRGKAYYLEPQLMERLIVYPG
jgi:hypothetical protein